MRNLPGEELVQLLHPSLHHLLLAQRLPEGHVGKPRLPLLDFEESRLDRILDDELDRRDRVNLAQTMLERIISN